MTKMKKRNVKIGLVLAAAVLLWVVSTAFYRDLSASSSETYKGLKLFSDVIERVEKNYVDPVDTKELIEKGIQGMVQSLDPHSALMPPAAFKELQVDTQGEFGGIGIVITMKNNLLVVISPIEDTPAHKAGVKTGDIIVKVDGKSTKGMPLWEAVNKMRGPKGTSVIITVMRQGSPAPIDFTLVRDIIPVESVRFFSLKPGYGYIRVTNFNVHTADSLKEALEQMEAKEKPLKGLVVDLRDNPGGLLQQAVEVSDLFLDEGEIVSIKGRQGQHTKRYRATANSAKRSYPIVVLINGGSASASEIVAGALQDHHRAVILGTTSFGKGSVQTVETLRDGYGLRFTIARYYTPSGRSIQAQGIVPDIVVTARQIDPEPSDKGIHAVKEKDLINHLEAEPDVSKDAKQKITPPAKEEKKPEVPDTPGRYGPLTIEGLQSDNQVMRALEIIISYQILQKAKD
ncbi:MAG: S41 family peptidase [Desulfobacterales bacterium]|nr:S41 family peptidase [Desulfobacterales bacterium]